MTDYHILCVNVYGNPCHTMWHLSGVNIKSSRRVSVVTFLRLWYLLLSKMHPLKAIIMIFNSKGSSYRWINLAILFFFWFEIFIKVDWNYYISLIICHLKLWKIFVFKESYHYVVWALLGWCSKVSNNTSIMPNQILLMIPVQNLLTSTELLWLINEEEKH